MAWYGKAFLGGLGWAVGGPIGGIIGAVIGHALDDDDEARNTYSQAPNAEEIAQQKNAIFLFSFFCMAGKIAKADGTVTREEVDLLENFMSEMFGFDAETRKKAIEIFNESKNGNSTFEQYAQQFYGVFSNDREILLYMSELLMCLAAADDKYHPNEERMMRTMAGIFGLSETEYKNLKIKFFGDEDKYYAVLECALSDDNETIKRSYRRLAKEHHPDILESKGVPPSMLLLAKEKLQQINEAYDFIKKQRGFN
jgi:DnaJ like chaperone protein